MKKVSYNEIEEILQTNPIPIIDFIEYDDGNVPILTIGQYQVLTYIKANEFLKREDFIEYYGYEMEDEYKSYIYYPYIRLVIKEPYDGVNFNDEKHVIHLNKVYMDTGYQELYIEDDEVENNGLGQIREDFML